MRCGWRIVQNLQGQGRAGRLLSPLGSCGVCPVLHHKVPLTGDQHRDKQQSQRLKRCKSQLSLRAAPKGPTALNAPLPWDF